MARNTNESYWEDPDYASPDEMYAQNNIEGFNYQGAHDIISNPLPIRWLDSDPAYEEYNYFPQNRYVDFDTLLTGEACTSDMAAKLCSDGYKVAQVDYVLKSGVGITGEADFETWEGITTIQKLVYRFVFVEHEGTWYIFEDRLVERQNL